MSNVSLAVPGGMLRGSQTGTGQPVVLLHAGGERAGVWAPVARSLALAGYTSVAYDLRGHGESTRHGAERLEMFAEDVRLMVDAALAPPVLVGSSLGGFAAMLALADPQLEQRTAALVLVDVIPDPPADATRSWLGSRFGPDQWSPLIEDILGRSRQLSESMRHVGLPVLLIRGGRNSPLDDRDTSRFAALVPHAQIRRVPHAGHLVARDAPAALSGHLIAWMEEACSPAPPEVDA